MFPNQPSLIQEALQLEHIFAANNYQGQDANPPISIIKGSIPIIIAAPHAVEHPRHENIKKADMLTGSIAAQVASATGCFAIILSKTRHEDPNHDLAGPFKTCLSRIVYKNKIKTIINLHGMAQTHPYDVVLGSNFGKSLGNKPAILNHTVEALQAAGLTKILVDSPDLFAASNSNNISVYSWEKLGVPAFQVEINRNFRDPRQLPQNYLGLINGLINAVNKIQE